MPTMEKQTLQIDIDCVEIEEIEIFLQEGSRGIPEFAASCSGICHYLCCAPSCSCYVPPESPNPNEQMDEVLD